MHARAHLEPGQRRQPGDYLHVPQEVRFLLVANRRAVDYVIEIRVV